MNIFYMSFADPERPAGTQWLGACVVEADTFIDAVAHARKVGCNPGGEVMGGEVPEERRPSPEFFDRLLTLDDVKAMWAGHKIINLKGEEV